MLKSLRLLIFTIRLDFLYYNCKIYNENHKSTTYSVLESIWSKCNI